MIGKQTKGRGFRGTLNYVLGKEGAEIIGGNMVGQSAKDLAEEFSVARALRPNLSRVVYHASLSLAPGEHLNDVQWSEAADKYMEGMGFKGAQYVVVKHNDTSHSHIHIVASRVRTDGSVVSESQDYRRSEGCIRGLEKEFGLSQTLPSRDSPARAPTTGELHKSLRENVPSVKVRLQNAVDKASRHSPTMSEFISRLETRGVAVVPNVSKTGHVSGISFRLGDELMKGSDLGRSYTWNGLQKKGINYEQNRDLQAIRQAANREQLHRARSTDSGASSRQRRDPAQAGRRPKSHRQENGRPDRGRGQKHRENGLNEPNNRSTDPNGQRRFRRGGQEVDQGARGSIGKGIGGLIGHPSGSRQTSLEPQVRYGGGIHGIGSHHDILVQALLKLIFGDEANEKQPAPDKLRERERGKARRKDKSKSREFDLGR